MISYLLTTRSCRDGVGNPGPAVITDSPNKYSLLSLSRSSESELGIIAPGVISILGREYKLGWEPGDQPSPPPSRAQSPSVIAMLGVITDGKCCQNSIRIPPVRPRPAMSSVFLFLFPT